MTQVSGVQEFFEAMVEVRPAGGAWTDISGWGATVAVSGRERQVGEGFTHDGDRAIVGHGKLQPLDVTVRAIYTEGGLDPYAIVLPALENHTVLQVRWSPYGGQAGEKQYTTNLTHSHVINCPAPSGEAGSGDPIMLEFTVRTSDIVDAAIPVPVTFPTTPILDNFDRLNEIPLNQTNWMDVCGAAVSGNQAGMGIGGDYDRASFYNTVFGPDCDSYVTIPTIDIAGYVQAKIYARYDPSTNDVYGVQAVYHGGGGADEIEIWGSFSTLLQTYLVTLDDGDKIGIRCEGDNISAYHYTLGAWALLGTVVDFVSPDAGLCGINVQYDGVDIIPLDDFGAGNETGVAFPEPGVIDNFNRANEGPPPSSAWIDRDVLGVVSNVCAARQSAYVWLALMMWRSSFAANQEAFVTVQTRQDDGGEIRLVARYQDGYNLIHLDVVRNDGADDTVELWETVTGLDASIGGPYIVDYQDGDAIGISAIGPAIEMWHKPVGGTWVLIGSGTTLTIAGGCIGLWTEAGDATVRLDDFGGGNI